MSIKTKRALCYHCGNSLVRNQNECLLLLFAGMSQPVVTTICIRNISPKRNNIENIVVRLYHPLYTRSD